MADHGARLIPLGELGERIGEIPDDRAIVGDCRTGQRSIEAARRIAEAGHTAVSNLSGGMVAWAQEIDSGLKVV